MGISVATKGIISGYSTTTSGSTQEVAVAVCEPNTTTHEYAVPVIDAIDPDAVPVAPDMSGELLPRKIAEVKILPKSNIFLLPGDK